VKFSVSTLQVSLLCLAIFMASCQGPKDQRPVASEQPKATESRVTAGAPVILADMSSEFMEPFKESKECRGIQILTKTDAGKADFKVLTSTAKADTPEMEELWLWTVFDNRTNAEGEMRGAGNEASAASAIKDMCSNVWDAFNARRGAQPPQKTP
jgi:hypothetical protein